MAGETMNPAECGLKEQMQKRYVDINPAIEFLEGYDNSWGQEFADGVHFAVRYIKKLALAEEKGIRHGEWKWINKGHFTSECSCCGAYVCNGLLGAYVCNGILYSTHLRYCPNCGAKMGEEDGK